MEQNKLLIIACLTGFIGDILLQVGANNGMGGPTNWGLKDYFKQHGQAESMFVAAGMMTLFYSIFILLKIPMNYINLALFGIAIDFLFRKLDIFKSLHGYYSYLNYFWSAFWMAIPMIIPFFILNTFNFQ
jgi:uncharacterized membrane protein YvlD (DUF360 family)